MCKNLSADTIGDYATLSPKLYTDKLAGSTKACMGFIKTSNSSRYVPNTILKEDTRDNTKIYKIKILYNSR